MNLDLRVGYRPFSQQAAFHRSQARFRGAFSGNRGGKSVCGAYEFIRSIFLDQKYGRGKAPVGRSLSGSAQERLYWIVAPDYRLGSVSFNNVDRLLPEAAIVARNKSEHSITLVGGAKIELRSAEDPRRLVADSLAGLWIDEAPRVKPEAWRGALRARLADQQGWALLTGSPLGGRANWVFQDIVAQHGQGGIESFTWTTADNPYIPRSEVQWAKDHLPPSHFLRDWQASWDSHGGAVYEEFSDKIHVLSEAELRLQYSRVVRGGDLRSLFKRIVGAIDWGWTAPGCILVVGKISDDELIVLDESYAAGRRRLGMDGVTWLSEAHRLKQKWGIDVFTCDPEDPETISAFADNGINAYGASNGVLHGIRRVAEAMHPVTSGGMTRPGLRILSTCTNLIREIRNYMWKPNKDQTGFIDEPDDKSGEHALDPMRYAVLELNPVSVMERFRTQRQAWRPVG